MSRLHVVLLLFLIASIAQSQTLPAPDAVTDPKQLTSKPNAQVEKNLTIEKLYMTRAIGGSTWSPDKAPPSGLPLQPLPNRQQRLRSRAF